MDNFQHTPSAYCESGVTSLLLKYQGLNIREVCSLGIGSGLPFAFTHATAMMCKDKKDELKK